MTDKPSPVAVSVVIPLYNKAQFVERAIQSVLRQTIQDFEIIVVNDGSTDNGHEIVQQMTDERIRLIRQTNAGVSAARNRGITESRSNLVAFLDSDDEWMPELLATILDLRRSYPEAGAYATGYMIANAQGCLSLFRPRRLRCTEWTGIIPDYFRLGIGCVWSSAVAVSRNVFAKTGMFRTGITFGEDLDMWFRIALRFDIAYSATPMAIWHQDAMNRASNRIHEVTSPLRNSLAEIQRDGSIPATITTRALSYIERHELSLIMYLCRNDGELRRSMLAQWHRLHGTTWRWLACVGIAWLPTNLIAKLCRW